MMIKRPHISRYVKEHLFRREEPSPPLETANARRKGKILHPALFPYGTRWKCFGVSRIGSFGWLVSEHLAGCLEQLNRADQTPVNCEEIFTYRDELEDEKSIKFSSSLGEIPCELDEDCSCPEVWRGMHWTPGWMTQPIGMLQELKFAYRELHSMSVLEQKN